MFIIIFTTVHHISNPRTKVYNVFKTEMEDATTQMDNVFFWQLMDDDELLSISLRCMIHSYMVICLPKLILAFKFVLFPFIYLFIFNFWELKWV